MIDLTARQVQILRAIIEEFITTANPVGSDTIDKKFNIGVSPATIRNEMVYLTKQGYLQKDHTSAGRAPTPLAMKLYVNELMKERELTVADEVSAKEKVYRNKKKREALLREVTHILADKSRSLGIVLTSDHELYHAGYSNLLNMPEFYDIDVMRHVLSLIEEIPLLEEIFGQIAGQDQVRVVYGPELGNKFLAPVGMIYMSLDVDDLQCHFGVLGSSRFDYPYIFPMIRYIKALVEEYIENTRV